jgi:myo-inositol 2-dehydrogenase/D-chiro-inositol 1-dehydrogenase
VAGPTATELGCGRAYTDLAEVLGDSEGGRGGDPGSAHLHADLVVAAAAAGKSVFCEKPMALTLADADRVAGAARAMGGVAGRVQPAVRGGLAGGPGIAGCGPAGHATPSAVGDPGSGGCNPVGETLIHNFDALRCLNPGAEAVEVYATADALVAPEFRDEGLLDTAVVVVRFDNHAAVRTGGPAPATGEDARAALAIALAALESARTGRPVRPAEATA